MPKSSERIEVEALIDQQVGTIRQAFKRFLRQARSPETIRRILAALRNDDVQAALGVVYEQVESFADVIPRSFKAAATATMRSAQRRHQFGSAVISFNPGLPEAAKVMARSKLDLIQQVNDSQRKVVRRVLTQSLKAGEGPLAASRRFRDTVGLTDNQERAVSRYREALQSGSSEALGRVLRDRRFDRTVAAAMAPEAEPLKAGQIDLMVDRYRERMLAYRGETIARAEGLRSASQARQEAWRQIAQSVDADPDTVIRTWAAVKDKRTRDTHAELDGQEVIGMDTPFETENGEILYPGDPSAPPEETINCRCVLTLRLGDDADTEEDVEKSLDALRKRLARLRKEFDEAKHPRDERGRWTASAGGEGAESYLGMSREAVQRVVDQVSKDLGFDSSKIIISDETHHRFTLNGKEMKYAGAAERDTGLITIYQNHTNEESVAGLVAHEIEHQKFNVALDAYRAESNRMIADPGPPPDPNSEYHWGWAGGHNAIMKPDGELRPPYDKKYPAYTAIHEAFYKHQTELFADSDGVSDYSAEYWKGWKNGIVPTDSAFHETLAEMAKAKYTTGKFPEHRGEVMNRMLSYRVGSQPRSGESAESYQVRIQNAPKPPTKARLKEGEKAWRELYRTVEEIYRKYKEPAETRGWSVI